MSKQEAPAEVHSQVGTHIHTEAPLRPVTTCSHWPMPTPPPGPRNQCQATSHSQAALDNPNPTVHKHTLGHMHFLSPAEPQAHRKEPGLVVMVMC